MVEKLCIVWISDKIYVEVIMKNNNWKFVLYAFSILMKYAFQYEEKSLWFKIKYFEKVVDHQYRI